MRVIGFDLDGIITRVGLYNPSIKLPWWLFYLLVPLISMLKPDNTMIEKMQVLKKGCTIIIITARPAQLFKRTEQWLVGHHVPFDELFCVGFGKGTNERKLKVIRDEKMEMFIDNDRRTIDFLKRNSVNAVNTLEYFN